MRDWHEECRSLRKDVFLAATAGGMGHLATSFSCVEILDTLYLGGSMRHDPRRPDDPARDRFVMSKGLRGLALYAVLSKAECKRLAMAGHLLADIGMHHMRVKRQHTRPGPRL